MNSDFYPLSACPICGNTSFVPFGIYRHTSRPEAKHDMCDSCYTVFMNPRPTTEYLANYYAKEYREQVQGSSKPKEQNQAEETRRAERLTWWIGRWCGVPKRHLDIGSSLGMLLEKVWESFDSFSVGIEPGDEFRRHSFAAAQEKLHPLTVYKDISEVPKTQKFDLITMSHVLEHIEDPVGYLKTLVNDYLEPEGYLVIEVPNLLGEGTALIFPHLFAFTQSTLADLLNKSGVATMSVETSYPGYQIHLAPPSYLTAVARKGILNPTEDFKAIYIRQKTEWKQLKELGEKIKNAKAS